MVELVSCQTDEELAQYFKDMQSIPWTCKQCHKNFYTTNIEAESHQDACKGKRPRVEYKKKKNWLKPEPKIEVFLED